MTFLKKNIFLNIVFSTLVYFIFLKFSLLLSIPGTNVTPIFPAAGFALAIVLVTGRWALLGILIGSFLGNFFTLPDTLSFRFKLILPAIIGIGATLQAFVGAFIINKIKEESELLEKKKNVFAFIVFGAGLACMINAALGVTGLFLSGLVPRESILSVWLTWYLGDTMGVITTTPFLMVWRISPLFKISARKIIEFASMILFTIIFGILLLKSPYPLYFILILFILIASLLYMQHGAAVFSVVISGLLVVAALNDFPVFNHYSLNEKLLILQTFIGINSIAMLLLSVLLYQQQKTQDELVELNKDLDLRVLKRTEELNNTLTKVQELKNQQDADYYLTTLILNPLLKNKTKNNNFQCEFIIQQKKKFKFKKWDTQIGGDICIAADLNFKSGKHLLFFNGDAMGKSLQGAGGALVAGTILNALITRGEINGYTVLIASPEKWLEQAYKEINSVFNSFDGGMMISCVLGLIHEQTGVMKFINAEHPFTVLYRDGKANFIEKELKMRKLGTPVSAIEQIEIQEFQLKPGDCIFAGSDGRDDIKISIDNQFVMNDDDQLFLRQIEKAEGDINQLKKLLIDSGEVTDDLSVIRIEFKDKNYIAKQDNTTLEETSTHNQIDKRQDILDKPFEGNNLEPGEKKKLIDLINQKQYQEALNILNTFPEKGFFIFYSKGLCYMKLGEMETATTYLRKSLAEEKNYTKVYRQLAKIYFKTKKQTELDFCLEQIRFLDPENKLIVRF